MCRITTTVSLPKELWEALHELKNQKIQEGERGASINRLILDALRSFPPLAEKTCHDEGRQETSS